MISGILIALAAGVASALMFASIISGAAISILLFYLAPLPLMVAAMGWGPAGAAMGGLIAGAGLGTLFGFTYFAAFILSVALPAWWLGHLALLGRPSDVAASAAAHAAPGAPPSIEWYPVGRVLLWIAGFAALTTIGAMLTLGTDSVTIIGAMRPAFARILEAAGATASDRGIDALVLIAPAAAAVVATLTLMLNLWLAAKITATSARLPRPWPDLKRTAMPPSVLIALLIALTLCFTGGLLAMLAQIGSATLMMAYAFTGFAVLHTLTLALRTRGLWLGSIYAVVVVFGWPMLAIAGLGIADAVFGLRRRYLARQAAPIPPR